MGKASMARTKRSTYEDWAVTDVAPSDLFDVSLPLHGPISSTSVKSWTNRQ